MNNNVVLIGRIANMRKEENNNIITIAVPEYQKNSNGEYDVNFIDCLLSIGIAEPTTEYCKTGDLIGIKGKLKSKDKNIIVFAERLTFLTSKKDFEE